MVAGGRRSAGPRNLARTLAERNRAFTVPGMDAVDYLIVIIALNVAAVAGVFVLGDVTVLAALGQADAAAVAAWLAWCIYRRSQ